MQSKAMTLGRAATICNYLHRKIPSQYVGPLTSFVSAWNPVFMCLCNNLANTAKLLHITALNKLSYHKIHCFNSHIKYWLTKQQSELDNEMK